MSEDLEFLLSLVLSGASIGLMYSLIALGFVLVYKATDAINFAQGEFVMMAGLIARQPRQSRHEVVSLLTPKGGDRLDGVDRPLALWGCVNALPAPERGDLADVRRPCGFRPPRSIPRRHPRQAGAAPGRARWPAPHPRRRRRPRTWPRARTSP